jgi:hypothetical protein
MALQRLRNLRPVKRYRSERYVLTSLITFALSVLAVRMILKLSGYAQIGNDTVHIGHVLWGGLALFAGALLLLTLANRWALTAGAVLSGGGVGLFIDEVGKFITQSNNYFTPAAAPIIYALFLATVLVYLRVRKPPGQDVRGEMYRALEQISGVLDREMTRHDLYVLRRRLRSLRVSAGDEATRRLAGAMLEFVDAQAPQMVEPKPGAVQRWSSAVRSWAQRISTRSRLRVALAIVLLGLGLYSVLDMLLLAVLAIAPSSAGAEFLRSLVSPGELAALGDKIWFSVRAVLEGGVGLAMLVGGTLIVMRREWRGLAVAISGLVCGLAAVNLFVFYEDQMKALIPTALEYVLLVAAYAYRRLYLETDMEQADRPMAPPGAVLNDSLQYVAREQGMAPGEAS